MAEADQITIGHVRLHRARLDAPRARQRLSYLLSSTELHPSGMAPSAVLVIRSMGDPLPEKITKQFGSAAAPSAAWEGAARSRMGALYSRASRPVLGTVPSSAEAVLFADYGELLACLALDLGANGANAWWWESILRHQFPSTNVWVDVWEQHPLYVPSAVHQIHEQNQAIRLMERPTPAQAWRLVLALARAFGLPVSALAGSDKAGCGPSSEQPSASSRAAASSDSVEIPHINKGSRGSDIPPSWRRYIGSGTVPITLRLERRALLVLSLILFKAPHITASSTFAHQLRAWLTLERERDSHAPTREAPQPISNPQGISGWSYASSFPEVESTPPCQVHPRTEEMAATVPSLSAPGATREGRVSASESVTLADPVQSQAVTSTNPSLPVEPVQKVQSQLDLENGSRTSLGGVFYLIQLLLRSDLLFFDIGFGGWALLDLLARCLLYQRWAEVSEDPVWEALALLDGREPGTDPGTDLGAAFAPQALYEAPESWLRDLEPCRRYVRFRSGHVELWHPEGFLTLDALQEAPAWLAADPPHVPLGWKQRRAWRQNAAVCVAGLTISPPLRRFLHFILPYARWRLRRALGEANLVEILSRRGMLYVTHSHVDLAMTMDQISLPARLAGLDANPGWVPLLGRVIRFHFADNEFSRGVGS